MASRSASVAHVPVLLRAHVVLRHGGQLDVILEAERRVDLIDQAHNALDLVLDLVGQS